MIAQECLPWGLFLIIPSMAFVFLQSNKCLTDSNYLSTKLVLFLIQNFETIPFTRYLQFETFIYIAYTIKMSVTTELRVWTNSFLEFWQIGMQMPTVYKINKLLWNNRSTHIRISPSICRNGMGILVEYGMGFSVWYCISYAYINEIFLYFVKSSWI